MAEKRFLLMLGFHFQVAFYSIHVPHVKALHSKMFQFSSVAQPYPTLCDPMNRSTPGLPVYHQLLESTETHVRRVGDAIQPSHPLLSPGLAQSSYMAPGASGQPDLSRFTERGQREELQ